LVQFIERTFPARRERAGRHIGGLSMGGYGAMRAALTYPELYSSVNSHSGALFHGTCDWNVNDPNEDRRAFAGEMIQIFGPNPAGSKHDLVTLAARVKAQNLLPRMRIDCGIGDFLLDASRAMDRELQKLQIPHEYEEFPGEHNWDYWDLHVREAIAFHLGR
jgi:S-formylglutathione hydrolase FrmB